MSAPGKDAEEPEKRAPRVIYHLLHGPGKDAPNICRPQTMVKMPSNRTSAFPPTCMRTRLKPFPKQAHKSTFEKKDGKQCAGCPFVKPASLKTSWKGFYNLGYIIIRTFMHIMYKTGKRLYLQPVLFTTKTLWSSNWPFLDFKSGKSGVWNNTESTLKIFKEKKNNMNDSKKK